MKNISAVSILCINFIMLFLLLLSASSPYSVKYLHGPLFEAPGGDTGDHGNTIKYNMEQIGCRIVFQHLIAVNSNQILDG